MIVFAVVEFQKDIYGDWVPEETTVHSTPEKARQWMMDAGLREIEDIGYQMDFEYYVLRVK